MADRVARKRKLSPSPTPSILSTARRYYTRITTPYLGDYIGLLLILAIYIPLKIFSEPFHQKFRLSDFRIQYPHAEVERVGVVMLLVYAIPIPLLVILATTGLAGRREKLHPAVLGLATTTLLTVLLTDILKDAVGRPRPDLLARCKPAVDTPTNELVTVKVCTETSHHLLHDGWRSFPSGHSSLAFAGLGWLALFLASQTRVLRPRASLATVLLCLAPLVGATLIAASRLEDYRHDVEDVSVGSLLGLVTAWGNWRRYWPALTSETCDEPYTLREASDGSPGGGFRRVRDEEDEVGLAQGENGRISSGSEDGHR